MKRRAVLVGATIICVFGAVIPFVWTTDDIGLHRTCSHCGMDRGIFDLSRMVTEYDDGTVSTVCSIHCAAIDRVNNIDRTPVSIKTADFNNRQLFYAERAFWAVGGKRPGVMSRRETWAFEKKEEAERFIRTNEGKHTNFEEAMLTFYEDMYGDTKMIRDRRKMKRMKADQLN